MLDVYFQLRWGSDTVTHVHDWAYDLRHGLPNDLRIDPAGDRRVASTTSTVCDQAPPGTFGTGPAERGKGRRKWIAGGSCDRCRGRWKWPLQPTFAESSTSQRSA